MRSYDSRSLNATTVPAAVARVLVDERRRGRNTGPRGGPGRFESAKYQRMPVALEAGEPVAAQHVARDLERRELDHQVHRSSTTRRSRAASRRRSGARSTHHAGRIA
jgi:hypothetical protein